MTPPNLIKVCLFTAEDDIFLKPFVDTNSSYLIETWRGAKLFLYNKNCKSDQSTTN